MNIIETQAWEIMVPYKIGKKTVQLPHHQEWDEKVRAISGGLTIYRVAHGQWMNAEGRVYKEPMIPVRIACTEEQIKEIMQITLEHYRQQAVYVSLVSEKTLILHREETNE